MAAAKKATSRKSTTAGIPHVIDGEQPRPMTDEEKLERDVEWARRMAGPPPSPPNYQTVMVAGSVTGGAPGPTGVSGLNQQTTIAPDPHAAQLSADYAAALTAWNELFKVLLAERRKLP